MAKLRHCLLLLMGCGRIGFDPLGGPTLAVSSPVVHADVGNEHSCAVLEDGRLLCWGGNSRGGLGRPVSTRPEPTPRPVDLGSAVQRVALGGEHTCALHDDRAVTCFGSNHAFQLSSTGRESIGPFVVAVPPADDIAAAASWTCARDGSTYRCWGDGDGGQLGDDVLVDARLMPILVAAASLAQIAAGTDHACALAPTDLMCWGVNLYGQLGVTLGSSPPGCMDISDNQNVPCSGKPIVIPLTVVPTQVTTGRAHTCILTTDQEVWCWGRNDYGQLGDGGQTDRATPALVPGLTAVVEVKAGERHTCARRSDDTVWCWGRNSLGELGDGNLIAMQTTPVMSLLSAPARALVAGSESDMTCALSDDALYCWGDNQSRQVGDAPDVVSEPIAVLRW